MHQCFKDNPNLNEAFITSDGTAFYTDNAAANHAATLENKLVKHETREVENVDPREELEAMNKPAIIEMAKALEIEFEKKATKPELIDMILAKQAEPVKEKTPATPEAPKMVKIIVTEEMLAENPGMAEEGVKVGDEIEIPEAPAEGQE